MDWASPSIPLSPIQIELKRNLRGVLLLKENKQRLGLMESSGTLFIQFSLNFARVHKYIFFHWKCVGQLETRIKFQYKTLKSSFHVKSAAVEK